jgi:hypothetical protein
MRKRLKKIERIVKVQEKLHQAAEWKLAGLNREQAELAASRRSLVEALNEDDAFHGLFVDAMARRLHLLAREADRVREAQTAQTAVVREEALRLKRTERLSDKVGREERRSAERREFQALLDGLAKRGDASSV